MAPHWPPPAPASAPLLGPPPRPAPARPRFPHHPLSFTPAHTLPGPGPDRLPTPSHPPGPDTAPAPHPDPAPLAPRWRPPALQPIAASAVTPKRRDLTYSTRLAHAPSHGAVAAGFRSRQLVGISLSGLWRPATVTTAERPPPSDVQLALPRFFKAYEDGTAAWGGSRGIKGFKDFYLAIAGERRKGVPKAHFRFPGGLPPKVLFLSLQRDTPVVPPARSGPRRLYWMHWKPLELGVTGGFYVGFLVSLVVVAFLIPVP